MLGLISLTLCLRLGPVLQQGFTDAELVGRYVAVFGMEGQGTAMSLETGHTFEYRRVRMLPESIAKGTWNLDAGEVHLKVDPAADEADVDSCWIPVRCGKFLYLVEECRMAGFASRVGGHNTDFASRIFHRRSSSQESSVPPEVPARFRDYFENGSIVAGITAVNPDRTVVLASSMIGRLAKGMTLGGWGYDAEIVSVTTTSAVARLWYFDGSTNGPHVGDSLTSDERHPKNLKRYPYLVDVPHRGG